MRFQKYEFSLTSKTQPIDLRPHYCFGAFSTVYTKPIELHAVT